MQKELLLEIGSEEIPAGFIGPAMANMQKLMTEKLTEQNLHYDAIQTAATPRRLAICVKGLAAQQPDRRDEFLGPAKAAAFDADNRQSLILNRAGHALGQQTSGFTAVFLVRPTLEYGPAPAPDAAW